MGTELERVLAYARHGTVPLSQVDQLVQAGFPLSLAADGDYDEGADKGDTEMLAQAIDATIDEACRLLRGVSFNDLPPAVAQAVALVWAAQSVSDGLLDSLGAKDPDDEMSDYAKMTGSYSDGQWSRLELAGKSSGSSTAPYGDVRYADPGYQTDGKKRYPVDTEAHVRAAWSYVNMPKNQKGYTSGQLAKVKAAIKSAGSKFSIDFATA